METVRELHVNSCHVPNAYRTGFSRRINRLDNIRCLLQPASAVSKSQTSRRLLVAFRQPMARNFCRRSYLVHEKDKRRVKFRIESKNFTCADIPKSGQDSQDTKSAGMDTWDPWGLSMPQGLRAGAMFGLGTIFRQKVEVCHGPVAKIILAVGNFVWSLCKFVLGLIYEHWDFEGILIIIAYHFAIQRGFKFLENFEEDHKLSHWAKVVLMMKKPLSALRTLWTIQWTIDQIDWISTLYTHSLLPKSFMTGAPGAAYTLYAGYCLKVYSADIVAASGWFNERSMDVYDQILKLFINVASIMLAVWQVGLPMESALALGGASGIAVGLATQDIVKNLLGGVVIATRRPFRLGDKVSTGGYTGRVREVGWYDTVLTYDDESPVYIPNSVFLSNTVVNADRRRFRFFNEIFVVQYQGLTSNGMAPSKMVEKVQKEILHKINDLDSVVKHKDILVNPLRFGKFGMEFECKCYIDNRYNWFRENGRVISAIADGVDAAGATLATSTFLVAEYGA